MYPIPSSSPATRPPSENVDDECCIDMEVPLLQDYLSHSKTGSSFVRTCFNGLNALSGVGILSVPYALSEGGWLSLILLLIMALLCCYTGLLLQRCMSVKSQIRSYPDVGEQAFGFKGRLAVSLFMYLELYLVAIEFLIMGGDNLDKLFPIRTVDLGIVKITGRKFFTITTALVVLPTTWPRSLRTIALFSAGGVVASLVVVASVLWVGAFNGVGFHERGTLFNPNGLPTSLGLYTFCYCAHAVFPTLYTYMEKKSQFPKVLCICFISCALNYGAMAVIGYLMYGEGLDSQITLNLPRDNVATYVAIVTTVINPFSKYALVVTPIATAIEEQLLLNSNSFMTSLTRTIIVISTLLGALCIPFFGYVMAFIGSFLGIIVCVLLPCLCYLKIFEDTPIPTSQKMALYVIIIAGSLLAVIGTSSSVSQIIHSL